MLTVSSSLVRTQKHKVTFVEHREHMKINNVKIQENNTLLTGKTVSVVGKKVLTECSREKFMFFEWQSMQPKFSWSQLSQLLLDLRQYDTFNPRTPL